jgi:signal peptidase
MILARFATWAGGAFVLALLLAAAAPFAFGDRSMVEPIRPLAAHVGDIITFQDPDGSGRLLVHRVRAIARHGDRVSVTTQGDANTTREHWQIPVDSTVGTVLYRVPALGFAVTWISSPLGRIGLMIVPALLLAISILSSIWRPAPQTDDADEISP